jgi:XTP/dITP diphosphohydrolase
MQLPRIHFVTTNAGKMREAALLFRDTFEVEQVNMSYPELQEDDLSKIAASSTR